MLCSNQNVSLECDNDHCKVNKIDHGQLTLRQFHQGSSQSLQSDFLFQLDLPFGEA